MRRVAASIGWGLALAAAPSASGQTERPGAGARMELRRFAEVLEAAVGQVSRPSPFQVLGPATSGSSYLLPGYGAIFVLPARALPGDGGFIVMHDGSSGTQPTIGFWRRDAKRTPRAAPIDRDIQQIEDLVEMYSREAERASREAEQSLERFAQEMRVRFPEIGAPPGAALRVAAPAAATAPAVPAQPAAPPTAPVATTAPAAPAAPSQPPAAAAPPAPPATAPWRFWYRTDDDDDARPADKVVSDVKGALIRALELRGAALTVVKPDDVLVVAVDFTARGFALRAEGRAERTLVVTARKRDLNERLAGRLVAEELRKRIEALVY